MKMIRSFILLTVLFFVFSNTNIYSEQQFERLLTKMHDTLYIMSPKLVRNAESQMALKSFIDFNEKKGSTLKFGEDSNKITLIKSKDNFYDTRIEKLLRITKENQDTQSGLTAFVIAIHYSINKIDHSPFSGFSAQEKDEFRNSIRKIIELLADKYYEYWQGAISPMLFDHRVERSSINHGDNKRKMIKVKFWEKYIPKKSVIVDTSRPDVRVFRRFVKVFASDPIQKDLKHIDIRITYLISQFNRFDSLGTTLVKNKNMGKYYKKGMKWLNEAEKLAKMIHEETKEHPKSLPWFNQRMKCIKREKKMAKERFSSCKGGIYKTPLELKREEQERKEKLRRGDKKYEIIISDDGSSYGIRYYAPITNEERKKIKIKAREKYRIHVKKNMDKWRQEAKKKSQELKKIQKQKK